MKVIITTPFKLFPPADGRSTRALAIAEYLAKRGFDVTVMSPENGIDPWEMEKYEKGFNAIFYDCKSNWSRFFNVKFMIKLLKVIKKNETCLIAEHPCLGLMVHALSKTFKFPYILDENGIEFLEMKSRGENIASNIFSRIEKFLIKNGDAVLAVSPSEGSIIKSRTLRDPLVIPNGINAEKFCCAEKDAGILSSLGISGSRVVVFFGNFENKRNSEAALAINSCIAPKVYEKRDDVRFLLIGKNPPSINYHPTVIATGYVKEIEKYINIADIVIVPLTAAGGTRVKILEAMACSKTVIASYLAAKGLAVEDGKDIILCAAEDFPSKILSCLNGEIGHDIPAAARKKALNYDWELILDPLRKLIYDNEE